MSAHVQPPAGYISVRTIEGEELFLRESLVSHFGKCGFSMSDRTIITLTTGVDLKVQDSTSSLARAIEKCRRSERSKGIT